MTKVAKFFSMLTNDESGTAVTEWVVVASIMALAGIGTYLTIGGDVASILGVIEGEVGTMASDVAGGGT
jgi:Flp pilus assembly pilin Flp